MDVIGNSLGKVYLTSQNKLLQFSNGDIITATNNTGANISKGEKVWINKIGSDYSIEKFYSSKQNFITMGSPTISNGIVSNFSENNYLISVNPSFYSNPWTMQLKFTVIPNSNWFKLTGSQTDHAGGNSFGISPSNLLYVEATTNGSSWDIDMPITDVTISENTVYWVRFGWTGSLYFIDLSTDGVNFTRKNTVSNSSPLVYSEPLWIGKTWYDSAYRRYWRGTLYLDDTYIESNGRKWWTTYSPNVYENTLTGIAAENIASGSTGSVKTILAEE